MRDDEDLTTAQRALGKRVEEAENQFNVAFNAPKKDALESIQQGTDPDAIIKQMDSNLRNPDLGFQEFVVVMATKNAASWAQGDLDSI